ncbi:elicitor peptide 6-like [Ziziphus jujuba]|uniref:Elicitor peptide 6-like n=1 Tax=Ziziphus jujuba TaxID=326968 RepID=A0ABM3IUU9_ZIZJJ|nr:elicitor peptide 6-like [Ziziphus jujuba]
MENPGDQEHKENKEHSYQLLQGPCNFLEQLTKAFLNCLGLLDHTSTSSKSAENEAEKNSSEENNKVQENTWPSTMLLRQPSPSPISSGPPGGQINNVSPN